MPSGYRALIIDNDLAAQRLASLALRQQGFQCECASTADEAEEMTQRSYYDAVVTELPLPAKSAYALILELLKKTSRPIIVVYTELIEPRLTKDLLLRGVDDVLSKPVHGAFLAGKVRALVDRRAAQSGSGPITSPSAGEPEVPSTTGMQRDEGLPISLEQLNRRLANIKSILPLSSAALDVFDMTRGCDREISQIAAAIQRDASLAVDVLKLANSHVYNPTGKRIIQLDEAVTRIGQNRVGELALATSALARLTPEVVPWLDREVAWRRSLAAGLVMESLIEAGGHQALEDGLVLSAIMHSLGRVALGMLFPKEYQEMIRMCQETGESLHEQERRELPTSHAQVTAHLLAAWHIPRELFLPLKFALDEYSALARLSEPLRTRIELVKVAIALGRLSVEGWYLWDLVQLPSAAMLKRLKIVNVNEILARAASDLAKLAEFSLDRNVEAPLDQPQGDSLAVAYCNVSAAEDDLLLPLLPSMGLQPVPYAIEALGSFDGTCIVNCLSASPKRLASQRLSERTVIVTDHGKRESFARLATTIALPCSYGRLAEALTAMAADEKASAASART